MAKCSRPSPKRRPAAAKLSVTVECPVHESFRVSQVAGLFDVPLAAKARQTFDVELPALDELIPDETGRLRPWDLGVIVGPSGSGKSTIARHAFGQELYTGAQWPAKQAVVDGFPKSVSIKELTALLTSVGFSSPPAWVKPFHVLSNGERFRCDLARSLVIRQGPVTKDQSRLVVFDEFTSVVDRTVAKVGSAAVSKYVRRVNREGEPPGEPAQRELRPPKLRFVAVTCHYDVVRWLEPDWVLDMASRRLARGRLRRPRLQLDVFQCGRSAWELFAQHHYLSASLPAAARLFVGLVEGQPAALVAVGHLFGKFVVPPPWKGTRQISRIVVLPDFQGVGIGGRMLDAGAELVAAEGFQPRITTGHPSMIALLKRSPRWRITHCARGSTHRRESRGASLALTDDRRSLVTSAGRCVVSARWTAPPDFFPADRRNSPDFSSG